MLGLPDINIQDQFKGFFDATVASAFPNLSAFSAYLKKAVFKQNLHKPRPKNDINTIDKTLYTKASNQIFTAISGSYNPIKNIWYFLQSFFGYSYSQRIQDSLQVLTESAAKYDSYQFANRSLELLVTQMKKRISKVQGILSRLGLRFNKKVMKDPAVIGFKNSIKSWLQPYQELMHGGVKGFGFTENDKNFLEEIRDSIAFSNSGPYVKDVLAQIDSVLKDAKDIQKSQVNSQERPQLKRRLARAPN
jgi:hypothetical protein